MSLELLLPFGAALFSGALALTVLAQKQRSAAHWLFFAGMCALAAESAVAGLTLDANHSEAWLYWQQANLLAKAVLPPIWLAFSLTFSRGNYREFLQRWRYFLTGAALLSLLLAAVAGGEISAPWESEPEWQMRFGPAGFALNIVILVLAVLVLMNLEKTFRTAVGTMRWRIKLVVLGLSAIFGVKIYVNSQALIYAGIKIDSSLIEAGGLLIGCSLIAISYLRSGLREIDVYPSHRFLYGSITILFSGIYLLIVGLLSHVVATLGNDSNFPLQSFFLLMAVVGLAMLLLSDRFRQGMQHFVSRHFKRPLYDYRKVWAMFTERTAHAANQPALCAAAARLISDTFNVLSVTVWLADEKGNRLGLAASTSLLAVPTPARRQSKEELQSLLSAFCENPDPFDLDQTKTAWSEMLRQCNPGNFRTGGNRLGVPVIAGEQALGVIVLADRVNGLPFSIEEIDLLRCIGSHIAANLLSLQLSEKLMLAKEQEAFQAVSAFFAHDLKNAASTLSLMLQNLPQHFDDPAFRADVLRGIAKTVNHMNHLINRLSVLRQKLEVKLVPANLNEIVDGTLNRWEGTAGIELVKTLQPLPLLPLDPEQMQNVVTNLLLNAREASGTQGRIQIQTARHNQWAVLTVRDEGCGMAPEFMHYSLFRPFQTTKKNGTGIGMFQCKSIVEAHHGRIEVESELGKGATFQVWLPLPPA